MTAAAIDQRLERARATLDRVRPDDLARAQADGALIVDLRPELDRTRDGALPGAVVIERIHLEWRLDPTSDAAIAEASTNRVVVLVCNEGYASSLAAADLRDLGLPLATDLVGGYRAWRALHPYSPALPTVP